MGNIFNTAEQFDPQFPFSDLESEGQGRPDSAESPALEPREIPAGFFPDQMESMSPEKNERGSLPAESSPFLASFIADLIPEIKKELAGIRHLTSLPANRMGEEAFQRSYQKSISEKIVQIDSVLNSLLNYIHINTPVFKQNTLSMILEEVLEANEKQLREKHLKVFKKVEKELPETYIHDEQMKFILNTLLQYVVLSSPPNGSIGFLLRIAGFDRGAERPRDLTGANEGTIEVLIGFNSERPSGASEGAFPQPSKIRKDEITDLILKLAKEILEKNRGTLSHEMDEKRSKSLVVVKLPIERRKIVYYERINL